jgi:hypothetical protein
VECGIGCDAVRCGSGRIRATREACDNYDYDNRAGDSDNDNGELERAG